VAKELVRSAEYNKTPTGMAPSRSIDGSEESTPRENRNLRYNF